MLKAGIRSRSVEYEYDHSIMSQLKKNSGRQLVEPLEEFRNAGIPEPVHHPSPLPTGGQDPSPAQDRQVLGNVGLFFSDGLLEVTDAALSTRQDFEDSQPRGLSQRFQELRLSLMPIHDPPHQYMTTCS